MAFGRPDPKDAVIAAQQAALASKDNEIAYLRHKLDTRDQEYLALVDRSAFRAVHQPVAEDGPPVPVKPDAISMRGSVYKPSFTMDDIKSKFPPGEES